MSRFSSLLTVAQECLQIYAKLKQEEDLKSYFIVCESI